MKLIRIFLSSFLITALFFSESSFAQLGGFLPGPAQSQQVSKALQEQAPQPAGGAMPSAPAKQEATRPEIPEALKKIKFKLESITLTGNHVYSTAELSQFYKHLLHKTVSVADLFVIMENITNYYRNNGYILSRAVLPEQKVTNGKVHIQVIEGFIGNVRVTGTPYRARCLVQRMGNKITENRPLQLSVMEEYLFLMNEIPGTSVRSILAASPPNTPLGSADVDLFTENKKVTSYFSYDNYGTRYIGPQQMTGNIAFNSIAMSGDALQFTATKTPKGKEISYADVNYNLPTNDSGSRLLLGGTYTQTNPLFVLTPLKISGITNNYYLIATFPMIRDRSQTLNLRVGFNYLDSPTTFTEENLILYVDHLRNLDLGLNYSFADKWKGSNLIVADIRQGLPILGYSENFSPTTATTSRPGGRGDYTKIAMTISRVQTMRGHFSLFGLAQGQWGFNPLLSSEQFAFGGSIIGRGYDPAEILGDKGAAATLELRYDLAVGHLGINNLQLYTFYDVGATWNYLFIGNVPIKQSATSAGIGVRFYMTKYVTGNFMWTQPITKEVAAEELIGRGKLPRVFFSVLASID